MHVSHLQLADYRSYETAYLELEPGVSTFIGPNGQGKTNLVEAIGYVATHSSHRVANDAPLVRRGSTAGRHPRGRGPPRPDHPHRAGDQPWTS